MDAVPRHRFRRLEFQNRFCSKRLCKRTAIPAISKNATASMEAEHNRVPELEARAAVQRSEQLANAHESLNMAQKTSERVQEFQANQPRSFGATKFRFGQL